jgi:hypothetical protein
MWKKNYKNIIKYSTGVKIRTNCSNNYGSKLIILLLWNAVVVKVNLRIVGTDML